MEAYPRPGSTTALDEEECRSLRNFILARVRDADLCHDIFQETYARLLEAQRQRTIASPLFYAFVVSRRLIAAQARSAFSFGGEATEETADRAPLAEQVLLERERLRQIEAAIGGLPPMRRQVFLRRRVLEESSREVAAYFGISINAVDKHVSRALVSLHDAISGEDDGER